jgi:hypothetical protein
VFTGQLAGKSSYFLADGTGEFGAVLLQQRFGHTISVQRIGRSPALSGYGDLSGHALEPGGNQTTGARWNVPSKPFDVISMRFDSRTVTVESQRETTKPREGFRCADLPSDLEPTNFVPIDWVNQQIDVGQILVFSL